MKFNWKRRVIHYGCGFGEVRGYIAEECKQTILYVGGGYMIFDEMGREIRWKRTLKEAKEFVEHISNE